MCCFGCLLEAAGPHKSRRQVGKGPPNHLQIGELDVNFERLIEMGKCRVILFKTLLSNRKARQQVSPLRSVNGAQMRKRRLKTAARFLECRSFECVLARQRQPTDQCLPFSERTCLEEMVSDFPGAFADGIGMEPLDRLCDADMQLLPAEVRDARKYGLTHKFMGEGERLLGACGARDDYPHLLRLLDDGEKFVNVDQADTGQKLKAETAPEHCGSRQHPFFILLEPFQAAGDNQ